MYPARRGIDASNRNAEEKIDSRTSPNVSLAQVLDLSLQKDVEQAKILVEPKPAGDFMLNPPDESEQLKLGSIESVTISSAKVSKRKKWKKPKDKPKRPLSAYNLFFQHERERLLHGDDEPAPAVSHAASQAADEILPPEAGRRVDGRIGFAALAKEVASKWRLLEPHQKESFEKEAEKEKERYKLELSVWKRNQAKREQEADEWAARRDDVVRSLSGMASEQERTERALQSAMSMQPGFSASGSGSQRSLERTINDAFLNDFHSQQRSQYDQLLLNEPYNHHRLLQQERALSMSSAATNPQESSLLNLHESPMDFYTRMIYAGTSDVGAANAMHSYLSAQYAAAGRSLGVSNVGMSGQSHGLPFNSVLNQDLLQPLSLSQGRLGEGFSSNLGPPYGFLPGSSGRLPDLGDDVQNESFQQPGQQHDDDQFYDDIFNLRRGRGSGSR
ncbi:high mobility group [Fragilaria crotonensis]|nr:high mobility group [Fragilaria crotonensis]